MKIMKRFIILLIWFRIMLPGMAISGDSKEVLDLKVMYINERMAHIQTQYQQLNAELQRCLKELEEMAAKKEKGKKGKK